ncbi:MAG: hypothetical protein KKE52_08070 [Alphaproteobacteria bacterium]|nr:hypothetical protein [Alphaproteobacteria bacterium]MBU2271243.1 hypothetical protein [Alphaproteobacteria bacterium]
MTAEIAIANKHAVALAADSKVTVTSTGMSKGYDTANKVFTLSKIHPVGIMIFGNAEFMGYPWETIIKIYRGKHGAQSKPTISAWAKDFVAFVRTFGVVEQHHKVENLKALVAAVLDEIVSAAQEQCSNSSEGDEGESFSDALHRLLTDRLAQLQRKPLWLKRSRSQQLVKQYGEALAEVVATAGPITESDSLRKLAAEVVINTLIRDVESPITSGFVIAGFGDDELFPTITEFHTNGYIGDNLLIAPKLETDIRRSQSASIRAFAQRDMVQSFMDGYDTRLMTALAGMFGEALRDSCLSVLESYGTKRNQTVTNRTEIETAARERVGALLKDFKHVSNELFSDPVMAMVNLLPKDELAHLAESLVALTSLKRRVSREIETVGGAIDVALISKGDGFVWIKRKHYFKPELNPQFFRNYFRDTMSEEA